MADENGSEGDGAEHSTVETEFSASDQAAKAVMPENEIGGGRSSGQSRFDRLEAKIDSIVARLPEQPPNTGLHRAANWLERASLTRIAAAVGVWVIGLTLIAFWNEGRVRAEERKARIEEAEFRRLAQIATAWEVLLTPVGGDIGKGNALNTLIAAGHEISGADLSCEAVGKFEDGRCVSPPVYNSVTTISESFREALRHGRMAPLISEFGYLDANFEGAKIGALTSAGLFMTERFKDVDGYGWQIISASFSGGFGYGYADDYAELLGDFRCEYCDFYDSRLPLDLVLRLAGGSLVNTVVHVPIAYVGRLHSGEQLGPHGGFSGLTFTFVHEPAGFFWDGPGSEELSNEARIVEESQAYLSYCATSDDFEQVQAYWAAQRLTLLEQDDITRLSDALKDIHSHLQSDVVETAIDEVGTKYRCGLSYSTVAPILKPRLLEMVERVYGKQENAGLSLDEYLSRQSDAVPIVVVE